MDRSTAGKLGNLARLQKYPPAQLVAKANAGFKAKLTAQIDPDGSLQRDNPQLFAKRYNAALSERGLRAAEARWAKHRAEKANKANQAIAEIAMPPMRCAWCAHEQGKTVPRHLSASICARHKAAWMAEARQLKQRGARLEPDTAL